MAASRSKFLFGLEAEKLSKKIVGEFDQQALEMMLSAGAEVVHFQEQEQLEKAVSVLYQTPSPEAGFGLFSVRESMADLGGAAEISSERWMP